MGTVPSVLRWLMTFPSAVLGFRVFCTTVEKGHIIVVGGNKYVAAAVMHTIRLLPIGEKET